MADARTENLSIAAFDSLPDHIKDWLSSRQATYLIMEINSRLGLKDEKMTIIPSLIFRLATQTIEPTDFINELSYELGVSFQTAKSITQDIEEKVLKPIENELRRDVGVDVKLIYFGQPGPRPSSVPPPPPSPPSMPSVPSMPSTPPPAPISPISPIGPMSPPPPARAVSLTGPTPPVPPKPEKPKEPTVKLESFEIKEEAPAVPFMLHREEGMPLPEDRGKEIIMKRKDYFQKDADQRGLTRGLTQKPVTVRIETPVEQKVISEKGNVRVVHYNGNRTPVNNSGQPAKASDENTVDLRKMFKE